MRTADDSMLMRTLLHTILQALVDAEATETAMATAIRAATVRPIEGPAPQTSVKAWNAFGFAADLARIWHDPESKQPLTPHLHRSEAVWY